MLNNLFELALNLLRNIESIWTWLNNKYTFDLPFFEPISFIPINLLGTGILTLFVLWFVKELIPGA